MGFDPASEYPLGERRPDLVSTPSGIGLEQVTLESLRSGRLSAGDLRATGETLHRQSEVAFAAGRPELAANLARAAELAALPDETVLEVYRALRPRRSTAEELAGWARRLEELTAPLCAAFVREAAAVYAVRGLLAEEQATL